MNRILVVDDEPLNNKLICAYLADHFFDVTCVESVQHAIEIMNNNPLFDLILLDRMMPGINGVEFATQLRANTKFATIPIIIQTAAVDKLQLPEILKSGIIEIITKPFSEEKLINTIDSVLKRPL